MYRDTSSVDCAPRELTHACSRSGHVFTQWTRVHAVTPKLVICVMYLTSI